MTHPHDYYMRLALKQARLAAAAGDVPIGAVMVCAGALIGQAHNQMERLKDPTAHAEMIAITQAAAAVGDWRLTDTTLYVTKEPCPMCAGAITLARIPLVVFGVRDPQQAGPLKAERVAGVLEAECLEILQSFFKALRRGEKGCQNSGSTPSQPNGPDQ